MIYLVDGYLDGIYHLLLAHYRCCTGLWQAFMEEQTKQNFKLFQLENKRCGREAEGLNQQAQHSPAPSQALDEKQIGRVKELERTNEHLRQELHFLKEQHRSVAPGQAAVAAQDEVVEVLPQSQQLCLVWPPMFGSNKA